MHWPARPRYNYILVYESSQMKPMRTRENGQCYDLFREVATAGQSTIAAGQGGQTSQAIRRRRRQRVVRRVVSLLAPPFAIINVSCAWVPCLLQCRMYEVGVVAGCRKCPCTMRVYRGEGTRCGPSVYTLVGPLLSPRCAVVLSMLQKHAPSPPPPPPPSPLSWLQHMQPPVVLFIIGFRGFVKSKSCGRAGQGYRSLRGPRQGGERRR